MTALSDEMTAGALEVITQLGAPGTLVDPVAVYAGSTVTETPVSYAVTLAGPVNEARRYQASATDTRVTSTFYVAASEITVEPTNGWRIVFGGRTWVILATFPFQVNGIDVAYQLDVGEVASD